MGTKKVSVAMTTYNGARFLPEQLESLEGQTRRPDELVVGDDNSADRSAEIVEEFSRGSKMDVRIVRNPANLGFGRNFAQTLLRCTGDYIFFCDQDDWWNADKLAVCTEALDACSVPGIVTHEAWLADADLQSSGRTISQQFLASGASKSNALPYGCCIGFDAFFKHFFLPDQSYPHDTWLFYVGRLLGAIQHIDQPLILYRRHGGNATESHATSMSSTGQWQRWWSRLKGALKSEIRSEVVYQLALVGDMIAAFNRNAEATIDRFGAERFNSAVSTLTQRQSRLERRAKLLNGPRILRPWRIAQLKRAGGYAEGSALGMLRDLLA